MNEAVESIKEQARSLSPAERSEVAEFLLGSSEQAEPVEQAWKTEIARRIADIRSGAVVGRDLDEVLAELRERFR